MCGVQLPLQPPPHPSSAIAAGLYVAPARELGPSAEASLHLAQLPQPYIPATRARANCMGRAHWDPLNLPSSHSYASLPRELWPSVWEPGPLGLPLKWPSSHGHASPCGGAPSHCGWPPLHLAPGPVAGSPEALLESFNQKS